MISCFRSTNTWTGLPELPRGIYIIVGVVKYQNGTKGILNCATYWVHEKDCQLLYPLTASSWQPMGTLAYGVGEQGVTVPYKDSFLAIGGLLEYTFLNTIFYYQPELNQWEEMPYTLNVAKSKAVAFLVPKEFANCG